MIPSIVDKTTVAGNINFLSVTTAIATPVTIKKCVSSPLTIKDQRV